MFGSGGMGGVDSCGELSVSASDNEHAAAFSSSGDGGMGGLDDNDPVADGGVWCVNDDDNEDDAIIIFLNN
tara:strand:+ start:950 stop:1162 length:213 start_codon:yes stop_codon:yes gene_type:complete